MLPFPVKTVSGNAKSLKSSRFTKTRSIITRPRERAFFEQSKCSHPLIHQSLLFVCRQLHADIWPFYAACHSFGFGHPTTFANNVLSYLPPQRLSAIRHLSLYVNEDSRDHSPGSRNGINRLAKDLDAMFDHYSDVFDNLRSFKIEVCSTRHYWPELYWQRDKMCGFLLSRLKAQYAKEEAQMRNGEMEVAKDMLGQEIKPNKWRIGLLTRFRNVKVNRIEIGHDASFMAFFERLPPTFDRGKMPAFGTAHIDFAHWWDDELKVPAAVGVRGAKSVVTPDLGFTSHVPTEHLESVFWPMGRLDATFKSDKLRFATLVDIGCRRS